MKTYIRTHDSYAVIGPNNKFIKNINSHPEWLGYVPKLSISNFCSLFLQKSPSALTPQAPVSHKVHKNTSNSSGPRTNIWPQYLAIRISHRSRDKLMLHRYPYGKQRAGGFSRLKRRQLS
ncbi:hypothetical protein KC19_2G136900 [Ceratodon purpureus]|uniref:Uncharacterized protein n=1 Tax=Ceratodon purpureus TaxID=3225 RepID=A0A8T0IV58_CERPU|nr:hypothetical protein KC19_2G136900 [Ceratodon purpureus]